MRLLKGWRLPAPWGPAEGWRMPPPTVEPDWRHVYLRRRVLQRWTRAMAIPMALLIVVPVVGGYLLGGLAAGPVARLQAGLADAAAPRPSMPAAARAPFYPRRAPLPMPQPLPSPVAVVGETFGPGESRVHRQPGLPIEFLLTDEEWDCVLLRAPGAGSATAFEWECRAPARGFYQTPTMRVFLAGCEPDCPRGRWAAQRAGFVPAEVTVFDEATWYAVSAEDPDQFGRAWYDLVMEHIWTAPAGVLAPDSPPETIYVAALARFPVGGDGDAQKIVNSLRTRT
jgi:hypothetical protein